MIDISDEVIERIRDHEGYRNTVYLDSLGRKTVGWGHLCVEDHWEEDKEYEEDYLMEIFEGDLREACVNADSLIYKNITSEVILDDSIEHVLVEMVFQLGIGGVGKFQKMWKALNEGNNEEAANQMLDSRWHSQTPARAEYLAEIVASV
jgi:GH24 family phage-related lysozyme (muramidase)